jgi:hypothetical protein
LEIKYEVIAFFNLHDPSSRATALGSTQPLTEMSTRNLPGVKGSWHIRLTTSPPSVSLLSRKCGSPPRPVTGIALPFFKSYSRELVTKPRDRRKLLVTWSSGNPSSCTAIHQYTMENKFLFYKLINWLILKSYCDYHYHAIHDSAKIAWQVFSFDMGEWFWKYFLQFYDSAKTKE